MRVIRHWAFSLFITVTGLAAGIVVAINGPRHGYNNWPVVFKFRAVGVGLLAGIALALVVSWIARRDQT